MEFNIAEPMIRQVLLSEFRERDLEIASSVSGIKEQMHARGLGRSTMTLRSLSEFFVAEFKARLDSIADRCVWALRLAGAQDLKNGVPTGVALFQDEAREQLAHLEATHDRSADAVVSSLQNSNMIKELRNWMIERMKNHLERTEVALNLEYMAAADGPKEILALKPTFYGMSIDLKELWKRYF